MYPAPLSLKLELRRVAIVLDPRLALAGALGLDLARTLRRTYEVWLVPELWQILDNTCHWRDTPGTLVPDQPVDTTLEALDAWEQWRAATDITGLGCFFVGHQGCESLLPESVEPDLPRRWQWLAATLEQRAQGLDPTLPLASAWRDAAALAAALGAAPILAMIGPSGVPPIVEAFARWGGLEVGPAPRDGLFAQERAGLRALCAAAGVAKFGWAGLALAIVQLVVPKMLTITGAPTGEDNGEAWEMLPGDNPWDGARAFWYRL
jgi:hypothetical protein